MKCFDRIVSDNIHLECFEKRMALMISGHMDIRFEGHEILACENVNSAFNYYCCRDFRKKMFE